MANWFILRGDKQVGPGSEEQIVGLINKKKITAETLLKDVETGETKPAANWEVFSSLFSATDSLDTADNPFEEKSPTKKTKPISGSSKKPSDGKTSEPEVDYSNEPDFDEFIKKRTLYLIISIISLFPFCCFLQPKFFVGDIKNGLIRMILCLLGYIVGFFCMFVGAFVWCGFLIYEIVKVSYYSDNKFYSEFKLNKKLFNL